MIRARAGLSGVFLTVFIDLLGFGIIIPLLPVYSKAFGADELTLGLLFGSYSGMQMLFAPFWGSLSDRFGRRPILVGGLLGTALSYVAFARADSLAMMFAARAAAGFFGATVSTAQAYIADVTTPERRAKGMGVIGAAFGLGFTFGPLFGGELSRLSMQAPGYVAAGFSLIAAAAGALTIVEPDARAKRRRPTPGDALRALTAPVLGRYYLLSFLAMFAFSAFETMFTRYGLALFPGVFGLDSGDAQATADDLLGAAPIAGRYLFGIGVLSAIVQGGLVGRIAKRYGEARMIVAGPMILGGAFLVIAAAPFAPFAEIGRWWVAVLGCFVMPFGFGINNPALSSLVSRLSPPDEQGAALGLQQSLASLARLSAPPCAGILFAHLGAPSPFASAAALLFLAAVLAARSSAAPPAVSAANR